MFGTSWIAVLEERAFVWSAGAMTDLSVLPGDDFSIGLAINDRGLVLGASVATDAAGAHSYRTFVWSDGVMIEIRAPEGRQSYPFAIGNRGLVTGETYRGLWEDIGPGSGTAAR